MTVRTFAPGQPLPDDVILPQQTHCTRVIEVVTGTENLTATDGIWTRDPKFLLGIRTADCAPIAAWDAEKFGIVHAGWRGLVDGIVEKFLQNFDAPQVWVGPLLPNFEIQHDDCWHRIRARFGDDFFEEKNDELRFNFATALASVLPAAAQWDERVTAATPALASWRRDHDDRRNVTVIGNF